MMTSIGLAGGLLILLAIAHSVIGELLIFRHLRPGTPLHRPALDLLAERRWRAIWSSWHLVTLLGVGIGAVLLATAFSADAHATLWIITCTIGLAIPYWLLGTRGRHPAWIVLVAIASLLLSALIVN